MRIATSRIVAVPTSTKCASTALPSMCCEYLATRRERRRNIALVLRRAIGGKHVDRLLRPGFAVDLPEDVEQLGVHLDLFVEPPVPHEPVQLLQRRRVVHAVDHIGERAQFVGMGVGKDDRARVAVRDRGFGGTGSKAEAQQHGAASRRASAPLRRTTAPMAETNAKRIVPFRSPARPPPRSAPAAAPRSEGRQRRDFIDVS